jgi:hypothetical protein
MQVKDPVVALLTPFLDKLTPGYCESLERSVPYIRAAGWNFIHIQERGNAYISGARAALLRRALNHEPKCVVYIDYDLSWNPEHLLKLIQREGDVVGGNYRFKTDKIEYMGSPLTDDNGHTKRRADGCIKMFNLPAGFLKITTKAIEGFMAHYPKLVYGHKWHPYIDLFNHGAINRVWHGEDFAFCRRWRDAGGVIWCDPNIDLTHHTSEQAYPGNFNDYLCLLPGGKLPPEKAEALAKAQQKRIADDAEFTDTIEAAGGTMDGLGGGHPAGYPAGNGDEGRLLGACPRPD